MSPNSSRMSPNYSPCYSPGAVYRVQPVCTARNSPGILPELPTESTRNVTVSQAGKASGLRKGGSTRAGGKRRVPGGGCPYTTRRVLGLHIGLFPALASPTVGVPSGRYEPRGAQCVTAAIGVHPAVCQSGSFSYWSKEVTALLWFSRKPKTASFILFILESESTYA